MKLPFCFALVCALSAATVPSPQKITGVPRLICINDHLYRGGQPTAAGLEALRKMGIATVVDLRGEDQRATEESRQVKALGMRFISLPMSPLRPPSHEQIARAMSILADSKNWPVFIHCRDGVDRTGVIVACYRIRFESWAHNRALKEAEEDGMHRFERGMKKFILAYEPETESRASARP